MLQVDGKGNDSLVELGMKKKGVEKFEHGTDNGIFDIKRCLAYHA